MTTLTFQTTTLSVINQNNQTYFTANEIGQALGYRNPTSDVKRIYERNIDEFTPNMTALVDMQTAGGIQKVRIFSLRGCHLIGMLSHTKVAKEFRKWVLDILDRETAQPKQLSLPEPEKTYDTNTTAKEIHDLVWLLYSHNEMNFLLGRMCEPLRAIGSHYYADIKTHYVEYKRHYDKCLPILKRFVEQIKADNPKAWEGLQYRLTAK
ncbi:prophage antirepressor [Canicola haemoglobinophilus]|uniref:Prophage antirepressor n=1 Tax=Canicola haemoglobinophilus TaxID=733 RepID=A0AB38HFH8_9PAST|nr:P22AR C-terminal domain-containing protein [Canicola haemoglobinophilus]STO54441.1 prophage antirepressor [Canicola haemoglobinophilus]STO68975.1 prophage antirepressor [Canicola haemoglobinophilus]